MLVYSVMEDMSIFLYDFSLQISEFCGIIIMQNVYLGGLRLKKYLREEYPRPQFMRKNWMNLNGIWQFELDNGKSGFDRGFANIGKNLSAQINVPFCPQSKLSGVEYMDFIFGAWYKRSFKLKNVNDYRTVLHFGAVDYKAKVFINGINVGEHIGGFTSFEIDISNYITNGENEIAVYAEDDERTFKRPIGKQAPFYKPKGARYTRTTGIWQTVWLEFTPKRFIEWVKYYPDVENSSVTIEVKTSHSGALLTKISYDDKQIALNNCLMNGGIKRFTVNLSEKHLWEIGKGRLYDVEFEFGEDKVKSYFGLREVNFDGMKFMLNGKSVFQRLVLDQGFYPEGIYTAPNDSDFKRDIELALACGFNGARLHQKIFEERFLYYCDKMGYIVWGEFPDWGLECDDEKDIYILLPQWLEAMKRDFNHPSIVIWCPTNEKYRQSKSFMKMLYAATKNYDSTRPCVDASGNAHTKTDIFDFHDYNQDVEKFKEFYNSFEKGTPIEDFEFKIMPYNGEPVMVSEYGGARWSSDEKDSWGYGNAPKTKEEFYERFEGLTSALMNNKCISGICYTQLYDVEQEQNGLYSYERIPKFDCDRFKKILQQKAAIEDE